MLEAREALRLRARWVQELTARVAWELGQRLTMVGRLSAPGAVRGLTVDELDAVVAHLYELEERHLVHIFETFHDGWDHSGRLTPTLAHYRRWQTRKG